MKVILISIDTLRSDHLGCYGYDYTRTRVSPFIDSLAEKGVVFERHYATDVPTPPSYTSMFFGMRAIKNGIYWGYAALVNGLIEASRSAAGSDAGVIVTGGGMAVIDEELPEEAIRDPHLTFKGIFSGCRRIGIV